MTASWKMARRAVIGFAAAALMVGTTQMVMGDGGGGSRLRTKLAGAAIAGKTPYGSAEFRVDSPSRTRLNVEVENVNLAAGTVLNVSVSHLGLPAVVGHITLSATGNGELELESQHGDVVPAVVSGDIVTVDNEGSPILAGVF